MVSFLYHFMKIFNINSIRWHYRRVSKPFLLGCFWSPKKVADGFQEAGPEDQADPAKKVAPAGSTRRRSAIFWFAL